MLLSFITTQRSRTRAAKEDIRSGEEFLKTAVEDDFAADLYENRLNWESDFTQEQKAKTIVDASLLGTHYYIIALGLFGYIGIQDLNGVLLCNLTDTDFIISDAPIVLDNPRYKPQYGAVPAGLANRGLQIFCPISPRRVLLLYDQQVYNFNYNSRRQILLKDSEIIDQVNLLQFHNAQDVVLFSDNDEEYMQELHDNMDEVRRREEITMPLETESMETEYVDKIPAYQAPKISPDLPDYTIMTYLEFAKERPKHRAEGREIVHRIFDKHGYPDKSLLAGIDLFEEWFDT